jgi:hypothetical protein
MADGFVRRIGNSLELYPKACCLCVENVVAMVVGFGRRTCGLQASSSDPVARQPFF